MRLCGWVGSLKINVESENRHGEVSLEEPALVLVSHHQSEGCLGAGLSGCRC